MTPSVVLLSTDSSHATNMSLNFVVRLWPYVPHTIPFILGLFFYVWYRISNKPDFVCFIALFSWRSFRALVLIFSHLFYVDNNQPSPSKKLSGKDVTIIIPTAAVDNRDFAECLQKSIESGPRAIFIVTDTPSRAAEAEHRFREINTSWVDVRVKTTKWPNKRRQIIRAIADVRTSFILCLDDHVFLPPRFFTEVLHVFDDPNVALCGTRKSVRFEKRQVSGKFGFLIWFLESFWNFEGAAYLARHNYELEATNALERGHFVISGRAMLIRTKIMQDKDFQKEYLNETKGFWGWKFGPLAAGDDNFITRWVRRHGYKIIFSNATTIETTLGEWPKFILQCLRWKRTTIQNADVLIEPSLLLRCPWTVWTTYIPMLTSGALFWDSLLVYLFWRTCSETTHQQLLTRCFLVFIWLTKFYKLGPYFRRRPQDFFLFGLPHLLFVYFHSLISLWSYLTFWDCSWAGRKFDTRMDSEAALRGISG